MFSELKIFELILKRTKRLLKPMKRLLFQDHLTLHESHPHLLQCKLTKTNFSIV